MAYEQWEGMLINLPAGKETEIYKRQKGTPIILVFIDM